MPKSHLEFSPEFSQYLESKGILEALNWAHREFKEHQNYPYELQDKRIIKQSLIKSYSELMGHLFFTDNIEDTKNNFLKIKTFLLEEAEKDAERIYGNMPKVKEEFFEILQKQIDKKQAQKETKKQNKLKKTNEEFQSIAEKEKEKLPIIEIK